MIGHRLETSIERWMFQQAMDYPEGHMDENLT